MGLSRLLKTNLFGLPNQGNLLSLFDNIFVTHSSYPLVVAKSPQSDRVGPQ